MRNFGQPQILDLMAESGQSVSVTPGTSTSPVEFLVQAPKASVGVDNFPLGHKFVTRVRITLDQAASGGSAIDWDQLPVIIDSLEAKSPVLGTLVNQETATGPVLKHIMEFFCSGYGYYDGARDEIPSTDGDTLVDHYQVIPMAHELFERPHHHSIYLGWLNLTKLKIFVAAAATAGSLSTGAVFKATCNVQAWIEYHSSDELPMPVINHWQKYEMAVGSATSILQGIGTDNALSGVVPGSRIAAMLECNDANNMGGATIPSQLTSYAIPQLGWDSFTSVDGLFGAFRSVMGGRHVGPVSGTGTTIVPDRGGNPYILAIGTNLNGQLTAAASKVMYTPLRAPGRNAQLTKQVKFLGDMKVVRTFGSAPSSGKFKFILNEMRELTPQKKLELMKRVNPNGGTLVPAPTGKNYGRGSVPGAGRGRGRVQAEIVHF